jgi:hypothetical protein
VADDSESDFEIRIYVQTQKKRAPRDKNKDRERSKFYRANMDGEQGVENKHESARMITE